MAEELDDYPQAFADSDERYPWEQEPCATRWQWGTDAGKLLTDIASKDLLKKRQWLEWKNGNGAYFARIIAEIDAILLERMGE